MAPPGLVVRAVPIPASLATPATRSAVLGFHAPRSPASPAVVSARERCSLPAPMPARTRRREARGKQNMGRAGRRGIAQRVREQTFRRSVFGDNVMSQPSDGRHCIVDVALHCEWASMACLCPTHLHRSLSLIVQLAGVVTRVRRSLHNFPWALSGMRLCRSLGCPSLVSLLGARHRVCGTSRVSSLLGRACAQASCRVVGPLVSRLATGQC